ncbi:hypothetical protein D9M68_920590 [compost metagenome]
MQKRRLGDERAVKVLIGGFAALVGILADRNRWRIDDVIPGMREVQPWADLPRCYSAGAMRVAEAGWRLAPVRAWVA